MKKFKTIIIDDERLAREEVKRALQKHQEFEIIGEASHVNEAITLIEDLQPDLLFLDIVLDENTAFDLLNDLKFKKFNIIFTTAYDEYAVKAFRYNTADYLLKPILIDDLILAVENSYCKS